MSGAALAQAAFALVGAPFRLHGRDPAGGLDCIGVLAASLKALGRDTRLPTGYPLRLSQLHRWLPDPAPLGFAPTDDAIRPGDVVIRDLGAGQFHLLVAAPLGGFVHAHAGLRRVIHSADLPSGKTAGHWRLIPSE